MAGLFAVVGIFVSLHRALQGDFVGASVSIGFLVPVVLVVLAVQLVSNGRTVLRADHDTSGTTLRADRTFSRLAVAIFLSAAVLGLAVVVLTLSGQLHLFSSRRGQAAAVVGMALASGTAVAGLLSAWRRGGVGYVKLTPTGIDVADIKSTETVQWADIVGVADHSETNKKTRKAAVLLRRDGTEKTIDGCDFYVPHGVGLYWMVRHYWRHPDDRPELTDGRALARLDEGRFDTSVDA